MNETELPKNLDQKELDPTQAEGVGGGIDFCSPNDWAALTESFKQSYENLVDFASHVIERVSGGSGTA